jgi:hypothetical protein
LNSLLEFHDANWLPKDFLPIEKPVKGKLVATYLMIPRLPSDAGWDEAFRKQQAGDEDHRIFQE